MGVAMTDHELELVRAYTMLGDIVADAYAALMPSIRLPPPDRHAARGLRPRRRAASRGRRPSWSRSSATWSASRTGSTWTWCARGRGWISTPPPTSRRIAIRGAFIATFLNKYSALPMALTGTLSNETAAHRVRETAHFFACTVLPGALDRFGEGFKAAAMVRLMHSMVRVNVLALRPLGRVGLRRADPAGRSDAGRPDPDLPARLPHAAARGGASSRRASARRSSWHAIAASCSGCPRICWRTRRKASSA